MINRRDFLKGALIIALDAALPIGFTSAQKQTLTFVDIVIDDQLFQEAMTLGPIRRDTKALHPQAVIEVSMNMSKMWLAVSLLDDQGNSWHTEDGKKWTCGDDSFEVIDEDA